MSNFNYKKSLGQNFLVDEGVLCAIVEAANIDKNTLVIEIGPGAAALSKKIVPESKYTILYEIDGRLEKTIKNELSSCNNYKLIINDFLKADVENDINEYEYDKLFVVANLPYYITTPIITKIIASNINPDKMILMVQNEVANRFCAMPGSKDYGYITVLFNYYYSIKKLFIVNKNSFNPKPKVDSAIIEMTRMKRKVLVKDINYFDQFLKDSFKFKRKNIKNNLSKYNLNLIENILKKYNLDLSCRAEEINVDIFIEIVNKLCE